MQDDDPDRSGIWQIPPQKPKDPRWDDLWHWVIITIALVAIALMLTGCWDSRTETASKTTAAKHRTEVRTKQVPVATATGIQIVPVKEVVEITEDEDGSAWQQDHTVATIPIPPAVGAVANAIIPGSGAIVAAASSPSLPSLPMGGLVEAGMALLTAAGGTAAVVKSQQAKKAQQEADAAWADAQHYAHHAPPGTPPPPSMT